MVAIKNLLLFAAAASALVIQERTTATVLANLKKINTATTTLDNAITSWDGSSGGLSAIQNDETAVDNDVKAATKEAKTEKQATSANSKTVGSYVTNTLIPNTHKTLNNLVAAKSKFAALGVDSVVQSDLKQLKTDVDALGAALKAIASSDQQTASQNDINTLNKYFTTAINAFAT